MIRNRYVKAYNQRIATSETRDNWNTSQTAYFDGKPERFIPCCNNVISVIVYNRQHVVNLNHRLRAIATASPVLRAIGFGNGKRQFSTSYRIDTPQPITKNLSQVITSATPTAVPN